MTTARQKKVLKKKATRFRWLNENRVILTEIHKLNVQISLADRYHLIRVASYKKKIRNLRRMLTK